MRKEFNVDAWKVFEETERDVVTFGREGNALLLAEAIMEKRISTETIRQQIVTRGGKAQIWTINGKGSSTMRSIRRTDILSAADSG